MQPASPPPISANGSVIGKDLRIAGEKIVITSQGRLQFDGEIVGDLVGREIVIGETAVVSGSIAADMVEVRGRVNGTIRGANVTLKPSAHVEGDILHQVLSIAEGAQFDGRVRRAENPDDVKPPLGPSNT